MTDSIRSVLIVGIDETLRTKFRQTLSNEIANKAITLCKDVREPISLAREKAPSLLVLEWDSFPLEQMTELLQKFRALPHCTLTPILILATKTTGDIAFISVEYDVTKTLSSGTNSPEFRKTIQSIERELARPSAFRAKIRQLEKATEQNDHASVEKVVLSLYKENPDSHRAKIEYANLCLKKGNYTSAISAARKALAFSPENLRALNIVARAHLQTGNYHEAMRILERSNALSPGNVERLVALGDSLFALEQAKLAKEKYQAAEKIDPNCIAARHGLIAIELLESDFNNSVEILRDRTDESEAASLYNNIGIVFSRKMQLKKAESAYLAALRALTQNFLKAKVHFNLGLAYERNSVLDKAFEQYKTAINFWPNFEKCHAHSKRLAATVTARANTILQSIQAESEPDKDLLEWETISVSDTENEENFGSVEALAESFPVRIMLGRTEKP